MRLLQLLACLALLWAFPARADTAIGLFKAYDGRVNFTGTQVSLRTRTNTDNACAVSAPGTNRTASLSLPDKADVISARLYWAGSGPSDSTVTFEGKSVTATRKYTSSTIGGGFNYFGGAADVTAAVKAKGSGTYNFSGLTVSNGNPWCASQGVLGGFALLVVYAHKDEPERVLNLYEGFRFVQNGEVTVNASNFRWNRTMWPVQERARIGHLTWEGDPTLASDGERLLFEGKEMSDALNPEGNQFNSRSNINNSSSSYGIDFDAYDTSVVIWSGYDASVRTSYRTGQDLVLLNAEILVVPTLPVSDLSVAIARPGMLQVGKNAIYTVTVTNNGPYTEAGPITTTTTLPAGMSFVSGSGTGWSCAASGQVVTCTYKGAFAPETSAAPLSIAAAVKTTGEKTTSVSVKGTDDDNASNNAASNTGTAAAENTPGPTPVPSLTSYVFTNGPCKAGIAIGAAGQTCTEYGAATLGGRATDIYLTAVIQGVPAAASTATSMTPSFQFALDCVYPVDGTVAASYAGSGNVPACVAGALTWSQPVSVTFAKDVVSVKQSFAYNDIGKLALVLKESGRTATTKEFVVAPSRIAFRSIRNGTQENPGFTAPGDPGFAPAGTALTVEIYALLADGKGWAPNFREDESKGVALSLGMSPAVASLPSQGALVEADPSGRTNTKGIVATQAAWSEVGAVNFTTGLQAVDAQGQGGYLGVDVPGSVAPVGRFYPAYFTTAVTGPFACPRVLPNPAACPVGNDAAYAGQRFGVSVEAFNANNERLQNFIGPWYRPVTLQAVAEPGGEAMTRPLQDTTATSAPGAATTATPISFDTSATLERPFVNGAAVPAGGWSLPTPVFVRAGATDTTLAGNVTVTSLRPKGTVSDEGGLLVLNGRLAVANALGTDTLRTPVGLRAEYWAGAGAGGGWRLNPGFAGTSVLDAENAAATVVFSNCTLSGVRGCDPATVRPEVPQTVTMTAGTGRLWLRPPGRQANGAARGGRIELAYRGWGFLPSTIGRVTFGTHRSPVIYVRELYF